MKLAKILSGIVASALAVSAMTVASVSVSAADTETVKLYTQNTNSWTLYESEAYEISADGDYSFTVDAGGETDYITLYIKDAAGKKAPEAFNDVTLTVKSITVNGKKLGLTKTEYPVVGNAGVFDVCFINGWAETFVTGDECPFDSSSDSSFTYGEAVNTFQVDFTISGLGGEAAPAAEEETTEDAAAAEEAPAEEATEEAAPEAVAVDTTAAEPASDSDTTSSKTGNTAAASVAVVMVAAAAAMAVSKRK
ncbi:MAG: hypothetical protein ACI4JJ_02005 [Huintestinicola sp.]